MEGQGLREVELILAGALVNGHFVYASGGHGATYVNKDFIFAYPEQVSVLGRALAEFFKSDGIDVVAGPAVSGAILAQWVAYHLNDISGRYVNAIFADKETRGDGVAGFAIKRGYGNLVDGRNVLVVEDVLTTGRTAKAVVDAVEERGGKVIGLGALYNRGSIQLTTSGGVLPANVAVPKLISLGSIFLDVWDGKDCPLCKKGVPIDRELGHGRA